MRHLDLAVALAPHGMYPTARTSTEKFFKGRVVIGHSNCKQDNTVDWEVVTLPSTTQHWEEYQYDRETNRGASHPHDMLYGFVVLSTFPMIKEGGSTLKGYDALCKVQLPDRTIPDLSVLKRIKGRDTLVNGMWILIVRMPRPSSARITVPFSRRRDAAQFPKESNEDYLQRRSELKRRAEADIHPTEDQLYYSKNFTLLQGVNKTIVCTKCGSRGHHHEKTHDDVYIQLTPLDSISVQFPQWMNVVPYPPEDITLTRMLKEETGFTLNIRETTTKVPLRLARKLLLDGLDVKGEISAVGVGKRKRELNEVQHEKRRQAPPPAVLNIDMRHEDESNRRFFWENMIRQAREHGFEEQASAWEVSLKASIQVWLKAVLDSRQ